MATYTDPTTIVSTGKPDPVQPGSVILLAGGALSVLVAGFFFWQVASTNAQTTKVKTAIEQKKVEAAKLESTAVELQTLSTQAKSLHLLFDNQKRWPSVIDELAERLHKDMAVTSLQANDKGQITLSGTVPDYTTYAKVYQAFTDRDGQAYFKSARPTSVTKVDLPTAKYISFTFVLTLQQKVLEQGSYAQKLKE